MCPQPPLAWSTTWMVTFLPTQSFRSQVTAVRILRLFASLIAGPVAVKDLFWCRDNTLKSLRPNATEALFRAAYHHVEDGEPMAALEIYDRLIVPRRGVVELSEVIHRVALLQPEPRRDLGVAARRRTAERFSMQGAVNAYAELYDSLASTGSDRSVT